LEALAIHLKTPGSSPKVEQGTSMPSRAGEAGFPALCKAVRAGTDGAFSAFYDRFGRRLYSALLSMTRADEHLARDLHQTVLIRASQKLPVLHSDAQIWCWLVQVARHAYLDHLRREVRRTGREERSGPVDADGEDTPERLSVPLEQALEALAPDERQLVNDFYFAGQPQDRLAEQTESTVKAIQGRLARIRRKLRTAILAQLQNEP